MRSHPEAHVDPVADDGVGDEPAGKRVEGEESGQRGQHTHGLGPAQHVECRTAHTGLDPPGHDQRQHGCDDPDRRIKKEVGAGGGRACERSGQAAGRIEEPTAERVSGEGEVAALGSHDLGQGRLLERRKRSQVDAGRAEHPGHAGQDQQRRLGRHGEVQAGHRHQEADHAERCPAADACRERDRGEAGQRRGGETDA